MSWLHVVVPGPLDTPTGGFVYDRRVVAGLRAAGRDVTVHELTAGWPDPDSRMLTEVEALFERLPTDARVAVDGLALGVLPELAERHAQRLRLVALVHHPLAEETDLPPVKQDAFWRSETRALAQVRHVIVTSGFTADALLDYGVTPEHLSVIPPGVAVAPPSEGSGGPGLALLSVGAVIPRKGHDVLLNALVGLKQYRWTLDVVGSETLAPRHAAGIRRLTDRLGLDRRVTFHGELDGELLERAYRHTDLFVLASHYEGYGMVLTEAVARGIPVVATAGGAVPFTLPDRSGLLAPAGDIAGLRAALARVMAEPELLQQLRRGATEAARALPTWEQVTRSFIKALDEALP